MPVGGSRGNELVPSFLFFFVFSFFVVVVGASYVLKYNKNNILGSGFQPSIYSGPFV